MIEGILTGDANDDGVITLDEFPGRMRDRFDSVDANGDGTPSASQ